MLFGKKHKKYFFCILATLFYANSFAQEPSITQQTDKQKSRLSRLDNVHVFATPTPAYVADKINIGAKGGQKWQDIPESISVMTRQQIDDRQLLTVDDALDKIPGIRAKSNDNLVKSYHARGYSMSALYDGVASHNNLGGHGNFNLPFYEAVEVIRGPGGIFRGVGEPGGVINFIKKRPLADFALEGNARIGSWRQGSADLDVTGPLNKDKSLRARAVLGKENRHFFYHITQSQTALALFALEWDLAPQTTANLSVSIQNQDVKGTNFGLPSYPKDDDNIWHLPDLPRKTNLSANWVKDYFHLREWSSWIQHRFAEDGEIKLSVNHRDQRQYFNEVFPYGNIDPATQMLEFSSLKGQGHTRRTGIDLYASIPFQAWGQQQHWLIGANQDLVRNRNERGWGPDYKNVPWHDLSALQPAPDIITNRGAERHIRQYGVYTQLQLKPIEQLSFILGGRYSGFHEKSRSVAPSKRTSDWRKGGKTNAHLTPYGAIIYRPYKSWSVYASHTGIFVPQTQEKFDGSTLDPREGRQYEIGLKKQWRDGKFNTSVAYFNLRDRNRAYLDSEHTTPSKRYYLNAGEVESSGWEIEASGSPYPGWDMSLGYTFLATRYLRDSTKSKENNTFDFYTPKHLFKLYGQYRFSSNHTLRGLSLGMGVRSQSRTPARRNQRPLLVNAGYTVFDLSAQYQINRNFTAGLNINNIFDKKYYRGAGSTYMGNFYGEPRAVLLSIRGRF